MWPGYRVFIMKIRSKLFLVFLFISIAPIAVISYISIFKFQEVVKGDLGTSFKALAEEKAKWIDHELNERVSAAQGLATDPVLVGALREANRRYAGRGDDDINTEIARIDREWIGAKGKTARAGNILSSGVSALLRGYQERSPEWYGEIFITDIRGATVAMTGTLTDYFQADEGWWQGGFNKGQGAVFLDHRGYDESVGALALGVVVPVMDSGSVIGILKVNNRIKKILEIVSETGSERAVDSFLADTRGELVAAGGDLSKEGLTDFERGLVARGEAGWAEELYGDKKKIEAYAPVRSEIHSRVLGTATKRGVSGESWEPSTWFIFMELDEEVAFAPVFEIRNSIFVVSAALIALVVALAVVFARGLLRPLEKLTKGAEIIGSGNLRHSIDVHSTDEIGELSTAFNEMAANLMATTVTRDKLRTEVEERKRVEEILRDERGYLEKLHNSLGEAVFIVKMPERTIEFANPSVESIFGYSSEECVGRNTSMIHVKGGYEEFGGKLKAAMEGGEELVRTEQRLKRKSGEEFPAGITTTFFKEGGEVTRVISLMRDISEVKRYQQRIKASLEEKEILLKEIHHRVKNNLQVISSILNLQSGYIGDEGLKGIFQESQDRIRSMALIHERLYKSGDLASIDCPEYIRALTSIIFRSYSSSGVRLTLDVKDIELDIDTSVPLGLILNELCTNALKYAFPEGKSKGPEELLVSLNSAEDDNYELVVRDNGVGLPEDLDLDNIDTMGLSLVKSMVRQLDGTIEMGNKDEATGATFTIRFPPPSHTGHSEVKAEMKAEVKDDETREKDRGG